jgi:hypothetical protein
MGYGGTILIPRSPRGELGENINIEMEEKKDLLSNTEKRGVEADAAGLNVYVSSP